MPPTTSGTMLPYVISAQQTIPRRGLPAAALTAVLGSIGTADRAVARGDVPAAHQALMDAQNVVLVLRGSLNHTAFPELTERLDQLYGFLLRELGQANIDKDRERLTSIVPVICTLRDAFAEASKAPTDAPETTGGWQG